MIGYCVRILELRETYKNQSIGMMSVTSSIGSPTAVRTIAMVTRPAEGIPAAPMAAAVEVKLKQNVSINSISWFISEYTFKYKIFSDSLYCLFHGKRI